MPTASRTETSENTSDSEASRLDSGTPSRSVHVAKAVSRVSPSDLDARTQHIGRELFERIGHGPRPWHRAWWEDRFIANTLDDPLVRVQLFRFIDALPALKNSESVRRHLAEYLAEADNRVPWWLSRALRLA